MSELLEQQPPPRGILEAWEAPPAFLPSQSAMVCSTEQRLVAEPLQPIAFALFGCAVGMIAMGAVCASVMHGWLRRFEVLDQLQLERDPLGGGGGEQQLPETRR